MTEKIDLILKVDGKELDPLNMGKPQMDLLVHKQNIYWYAHGPLGKYHIWIRLDRKATKEEIVEFEEWREP